MTDMIAATALRERIHRLEERCEKLENVRAKAEAIHKLIKSNRYSALACARLQEELWNALVAAR